MAVWTGLEVKGTMVFMATVFLLGWHKVSGPVRVAAGAILVWAGMKGLPGPTRGGGLFMAAVLYFDGL